MPLFERARHDDLHDGIMREVPVLRSVESILYHIDRRSDDEPCLETRAVEIGLAAEREMQLAGIAAHFDVSRPPDRLGVEMSGTEKLEEGRLRVDRRDDSLGADRLAAIQNDADGAVVL